MTTRREILTAAAALPVAAIASDARASSVAPSFDDLTVAYAQLQTMINLHNEAAGIPNDQAELYRYKRMMQVQAAIELGLR